LAPRRNERFVASPICYRGEAELLGQNAGIPQRLCIGEVILAHKYIDCREFPSVVDCTVAVSADSEEELLEAAVQHAVQRVEIKR
jgi:hypothetical protein